LIHYDEEEDLLVVQNPTGDRTMSEKKFKNNVEVSLDFSGNITMLIIKEASIFLGVPKKYLKNFAELRKW